jgi:hypothetical protein
MGATPSIYLTPHQREVFGHVPITPAESELGSVKHFAGVIGIEPMTYGLTVHRSTD